MPRDASTRPEAWLATYEALPSSHPLKIAIRTYGLALSLSLLPSVLPQILSGKIRPSPKLKAALNREFSLTGFPFAMAVAFGGGAALESWWSSDSLASGFALNFRLNRNASSGDEISLPPSGAVTPTHRSPRKRARDTLVAHALSSALAFGLMDLRRSAWTHGLIAAPRKSANKASPTLDLTLLLLVRALDAAVQGWIKRQSESADEKHVQRIRWLDAQLDGLLFWLCSSRIMWAFFYLPERLPRSYVKWINALARIDPRLILVLQAVRERTWVYGRAPHPAAATLMTSLATSMGLPASWGDPMLLPGHSGARADVAWAQLGVRNRAGVGGLPCELVHGRSYGSSCTGNALGRTAVAFGQALLIYAPVHALPVLLASKRRRALLTDPAPVLLRTATNAARSAAFLSAFIGLIWSTICASRSTVLPRLPFLRERVSHQFWDGPQGCILLGCLTCGLSIFIESPSRRGEIALYVMPRAIRSLLRWKWVDRSNGVARLVERTVAVLALAWLAMAAKHDTGSLRGLSRWALAFVMRGRAPNGSSGTTKTLPAPSLPISASGNVLASAHPEEEPASTTSDIQTQVYYR